MAKQARLFSSNSGSQVRCEAAELERGEMLKEGEGLFKLLGIGCSIEVRIMLSIFWKTIMLASMEEAALEAHVADNQHVMDKKGMILLQSCSPSVMERWKSYHDAQTACLLFACLQGDPDAMDNPSLPSLRSRNWTSVPRAQH